MDAKEIIKDLKGTIIADLKSLIFWAKEFDSEGNKERNCKENLGGLNYSLFLQSLVACETIGYYSTGAQYHIEDPERIPDVGKYSVFFLQDYFESESYFKKIKGILANYLRHSLVHGYGSIADDSVTNLVVIISNDSDYQIKSGYFRGNKALKLNAIEFAKQILSAFSKLEEKINKKDKDIIDKFEKAKKHEIKYSVKIKNEFNSIYEETQRKGLCF